MLHRYQLALILLSVVVATGSPARAQALLPDDEPFATPVSGSAFADAENAYLNGEYGRAVALYGASMSDYGRESDQHASYVQYRIGSALIHLGYAVPYGSRDAFGTTEDYALRAEQMATEAIRLAGIDGGDPYVDDLLAAARVIKSGEPYNPYLYLPYTLSQHWLLDREPITATNGYARLPGTTTTVESYAQMFVVRAHARFIQANYGEAVGDALVALEWDLAPADRTEMVYLVASSFESGTLDDSACQYFRQGIDLAHDDPEYLVQMQDGADRTCRQAPDGQDSVSRGVERIQFQRGATSASARGSASGTSSALYLVSLQQGQRVRVTARATSGAGDVYVHGYAPGRPVEVRYRLPDDAPADPNVYEGRPSRSGDYQFVVSSRGGQVGFNIDVEAY